MTPTILIVIGLLLMVFVLSVMAFAVSQNFPAIADRDFRNQSQKDGQGKMGKVNRLVNPLGEIEGYDFAASGTTTAGGDLVVTLPAAYVAATVTRVVTQNMDAAAARSIALVDISVAGQFTLNFRDAAGAVVNAGAVTFGYTVYFVPA